MLITRVVSTLFRDIITAGKEGGNPVCQILEALTECVNFANSNSSIARRAPFD